MISIDPNPSIITEIITYVVFIIIAFCVFKIATNLFSNETIAEKSKFIVKKTLSVMTLSVLSSLFILLVSLIINILNKKHLININTSDDFFFSLIIFVPIFLTALFVFTISWLVKLGIEIQHPNNSITTPEINKNLEDVANQNKQ